MPRFEFLNNVQTVLCLIRQYFYYFVVPFKWETDYRLRYNDVHEHFLNSK